MRNWFTFGDIDSRDFGVYISGGGTFNSPQRLYDTIKVPGRDGNLLSTENSLDDVELTYPAFIYRDFKENIAGLRAALLGKIGYQRLTDTYHTDEYREAYFAGAIDVDTTPVNDAGQFDITFVCHPQRYLVSGETPIVLTEGSVSHTASGNPVIIDNSEDLYTVKDLTLTLTPSQDLNGYDYAWAGGNGKNKLNNTAVSRVTGGITFTVNSDGSITANGTSTANVFLDIGVIDTPGEYILNGCPSGGSNTGYSLRNADSSIRDYGNGANFTVAEGGSETIRIVLGGGGGVVANNLTFKPMVRRATEADATYAPYENICPINGAESVTVKRTGKNLLDTSGMSMATLNGVTYSRDTNGAITIGGKATANTYKICSSFYAQKDVQYVLTGTPSGGGGGKYRMTVGGIGYDTGSGLTFTGDGLSHNVSIDVYPNYPESGTLTFSPMIRPASISDNTYEPYSGIDTKVDFGQTVYGGTVDIISGTLTIDRQIFRVGDLSWSRSGDTFRYSNTQLTGAAGTSLSDTFKYNPYSATMVDGDFLVYGGSALVVKMSTPTTASAFKSAYGDAKFCLQIRNQTVVQLTPHQIDLLTGHNVLTGSHELSVIYIEPVDLVNPTPMAAKPLMNVTGHGTLIVNGCYFEISDTYDNIDIDFDLMDATHDGQNANSEIAVSDLDFPVLHGGTNKILFDDTITKLTITPKWWRP